MRHLHDRRRRDRRARDLTHWGIDERRSLADRRGIVVREISLDEWMRCRVRLPARQVSPDPSARSIPKLPLPSRSNRFVRITHVERTMPDRRRADSGPPPGRPERRNPEERRTLVVSEISYLDFLDSTRCRK